MKISIHTTRIHPYSMSYEFDWLKEINVLDAVLLDRQNYALLVIVKIDEDREHE